jgi:hypothetical protein
MMAAMSLEAGPVDGGAFGVAGLDPPWQGYLVLDVVKTTSRRRGAVSITAVLRVDVDAWPKTLFGISGGRPTAVTVRSQDMLDRSFSGHG